ncbi:MAG: hypothetical protein HN467_00885 [Opitutae bacterium]|nr:hypothetical protein [Opitutae bacterium]
MILIRQNIFVLLSAILLLLGTGILNAQNLDDLINGTKSSKKESSILDELIEGNSQGYAVRLVRFDSPEDNIDEHLFWRTYKGLVTASAIPDEFSIDGEPIMQTTVGQKQILEGPLPKLKPTTGFAKLEKREHILNPGRIKIQAPGGDVETGHPAVIIDKTPVGTTLRIQLAPVIFESLTDDDQPVPFHPEVVCAEKPLLSKSLRFRKLTLWLPIGLTYESSFGRFRLETDGTIRYVEEEFPEEVTFSGKGFIRKYPARETRESRPIENPEFHVLRRDNKVLSIYTELWTEPGRPLLIALSAKQYQKITSKPFSRKNILRKPRAGKPIFARRAKPPSTELEAYVAEKLECPAQDIVWNSIDFEQHKGPTYVQFEITGLGTIRRNILVQTKGDGLYLQTHRQRNAFAPDEMAPINIYIGKGFPGGTATFTARSRTGLAGENQHIAKIKLPTNPGPGYDSRLLHLQTSCLAPGQYNLHIRLNNKWQSQTCPITITRAPVKSPFTPFVKDWFGNIENHEFLQILEDANIRFLVNGPRLHSSMPRIHSDLHRRLESRFGALPPPESVTSATHNDRVLDNLLIHRISHIDFAPTRRDALYNEGSSYHHSHQPDVERMIRRLQIFSQQTMDYPNAVGVTLAIDTRHEGSRYGFGTPTDTNVIKRNKALFDKLKSQGLTPLSREEFQFLQQNPRSQDSMVREKVDSLRERDLAYWNASAAESYQKHNLIYLEAIKKINPQATALVLEESDFAKEHQSLESFTESSIYFANMNSGDWPMSSAFTTDWARAHAPKRPVWLTVQSDGPSEGTIKNLLHAFGRGLQGGGIDLNANEDSSELRRRAKFMKFITQYGAIAKFAIPDQTVTIVTTGAKQRYVRNGIFDYHAVYTFFTRLGFPPRLMEERVFHPPAQPSLIVLVNEEHDLLPKTRARLQEAHKNGHEILAIGIKPRDVPVDHHIENNLLSIYKNTNGSGFGTESHHWLWDQFIKRKDEFSGVLKTAKLKPKASTDSGRGYVLTLDDGPIRYIVIIADRARSHPSKIVREPALPVIIDGNWPVVRDLRLQKNLPTEKKNNQTHVKVSLETEPCTLLALLPERVEKHDQYRAPALIEVHDQEGNLLEKSFSTTDASLKRESGVVTLQELLTGLTTKSNISVTTTKKIIHKVPEVHVVNPLHKVPELILLEANRSEILPIARNLALKINARLWQLQSDDFDEHPFRWQPRANDHARIQQIRNGKLVGYRKSLSSFLDADKRHNPALGGYRSINPPFMIGQDCILFSGGELANSLREVSSWLDTPSSPGRGQARILTVHSPFFSGKNAVCLVANDLDGFKKAADHLAKEKNPESGSQQTSSLASDPDASKSVGRKPVPTPFRNYSAHRHIEGIQTTSNGQTSILFSEENGTAIVSPEGKTTVAIKPLDHPVRILPDGTLWAVQTYGDETGHVVFRKLDSNGNLLREFEIKDCNFSPVGSKNSPTISPDGKTAIIGRPGEILFIDLEDDSIRTFDDTSNIPHKYSAFYPRVPVSTTFSPNGKYLLVTLDSRPPISGISSSTFRPTFSTTLLLDTISPESPIWIMDEEKSRKSTFAIHPGFASVANDGTCALAGYDGEIFIIDPDGEILHRHKYGSNRSGNIDRQGPVDGVTVAIATNGGLAAFAFRKKLYLWNDGNFEDIDIPQGIISLIVQPDGSQVYLSTDLGNLMALDPKGNDLWKKQLQPDVHLANAPDHNLLAADGSGILHQFSADGQLIRKTNVWEDSLPLTHQIVRPMGFKREDEKTHYNEPDTLKIAQQILDAEQVDIWEPKGLKREHHGKTFHYLEGQITFNTQDCEDTFLHMVYHKKKSDNSLIVEVDGKKNNIFHLDMPTPAYRVVNIPIQGLKTKVVIRLNTSIGIAHCSLWSIQWPGTNIAYQPPVSTLLEPENVIKKTQSLTDDLLGEDLLQDIQKKSPQDNPVTKSTNGKQLRVWWPNTDPLRTQGHFLTPKLDPRLIVDRNRFNATPPWTNYHAPWGGSFTIEFKRPIKASLIATYDRETRQSRVTKSIVAFNGIPRNSHDSPTPFDTIINNDQFWRLIRLSNRNIKTLGVHAFSGHGPDGLGEIEVYPSRKNSGQQ